MGFDGSEIAGDEFAFDDATVGDGEFAERAVLVFHGEEAFGAGRNEVDFASGEVGDVGGVATTEAMAFLGFLAAEFEAGGEHLAGFEGEVDLDRVSASHREAEFFGIATDIVVVDGEAGVADDVIETVEGGTAEAEFFGVGGEGGGGGEGGDAEDDVVVGVDIFFEAHFDAFHVDAEVGHIEVAAGGLCVGEHVSAFESEFFEDTVVEAFVEVVVGLALDFALGVGEEGHAARLGEVREVDEDANLATEGGFEDGAEEFGETEFGELAEISGLLDSRRGGHRS